MATAYVYEDSATGWRPLSSGDLPNSGVTAGTYGDATHVSQVTVDAQGLITSASNVAITGGGGGITDLTSTGSTITVTSPTGPTTNVDLPASGVSAGSYGDATHVGSFTVDAEGRLTAASSTAISGIAGTGMVKLFDTTIGSAANTIDTGASAIAAGHSDLIVYLIGQCSDAGATASIGLRFNGDSLTHYDWGVIRNNLGSAGASQSFGDSSILFTFLPAASVGGNFAGSAQIAIPSYDQTTFYKSVTGTGGTTGTAISQIQAQTFMGVWASTTAINQITVVDRNGGNFLVGSRLVVYGAQ